MEEFERIISENSESFRAIEAKKGIIFIGSPSAPPKGKAHMVLKNAISKEQLVAILDVVPLHPQKWPQWARTALNAPHLSNNGRYNLFFLLAYNGCEPFIASQIVLCTSIDLVRDAATAERNRNEGIAYRLNSDGYDAMARKHQQQLVEYWEKGTMLEHAEATQKKIFDMVEYRVVQLGINVLSNKQSDDELAAYRFINAYRQRMRNHSVQEEIRDEPMSGELTPILPKDVVLIPPKPKWLEAMAKEKDVNEEDIIYSTDSDEFNSAPSSDTSSEEEEDEDPGLDIVGLLQGKYDKDVEIQVPSKAQAGVGLPKPSIATPMKIKRPGLSVPDPRKSKSSKPNGIFEDKNI